MTRASATRAEGHALKSMSIPLHRHQSHAVTSRNRRRALVLIAGALVVVAVLQYALNLVFLLVEEDAGTVPSNGQEYSWRFDRDGHLPGYGSRPGEAS